MIASSLKKILLTGSLIGLSAITVSACCGSSKDSGSSGAGPEESASAVATAEPVPTAAEGPAWKQKCPEAERQESGTVTALKTMQIYKSPDTSGEKLTTIGRGTWVDLLGAKGTWYCIDYPCGVAKLCPGWVEERYSERKTAVVDAGTDAKVDAAADTGVADTGVVDTGTPDTGAAAVVDAGKAVVADAGARVIPINPLGKSPPGQRPPTKPVAPK